MPRIDAVILRGVTHMYGSHAALRRVSLELHPGPILFIQGSNGAGKSTLMSLLATVQRPTSGEIEYRPFGRIYQDARRHIGWAAHESHCYRDLTVRENVLLAAALYGVPEADAWPRVGARLGLEGFAEQRLGTLSSGQRQRASLARALVHNPSLLLLDEPLSGLDETSRELVASVLVEQSARGTLVAVITHQPEFSARLRGRVVVLERGLVVRDDPPKA